MLPRIYNEAYKSAAPVRWVQRKRDDRGSQVETNRFLTRPTAKNILIGLGGNPPLSAATDAPNANFIARRQHRIYRDRRDRFTICMET